MHKKDTNKIESGIPHDSILNRAVRTKVLRGWKVENEIDNSIRDMMDSDC